MRASSKEKLFQMDPTFSVPGVAPICCRLKERRLAFWNYARAGIPTSYLSLQVAKKFWKEGFHPEPTQERIFI